MPLLHLDDVAIVVAGRSGGRCSRNCSSRRHHHRWEEHIGSLQAKSHLLDSPLPPPPGLAAVAAGAAIWSCRCCLDSTITVPKCHSLSSQRQASWSRYLSRWDIQFALHGGCPTIYRKVINSGKRLCAHVGLDEGEDKDFLGKKSNGSSKHCRHTENSSNFLPLPASVRWHRIF